VRVVIAPDKLKGTYSAVDAAVALAAGWRAQRPDDAIACVPLADGGEGTAEALLRARGGGWEEVDAHDALGRPIRARFALLDGGEAALDVAEACGLWRVFDRPLDPLGASSRGAGELLAAALASAARRVVVGVGGTASTDGGAGMRAALGPLPQGVELVAALDVDNPLLGPAGAAAVFGPQKGATPAQVAELDRRLAGMGLPDAERSGAGAGGGIGAMLLALGATAVRGAELVADEAGLRDALAGADLCISAEGRIDAATLRGKVVGTVADLCRGAGVPLVAVAGAAEVGAAAALAARGARIHVDGDLRRAGAALAAGVEPHAHG
jgi:glycerate 2-kinase